MFLLLCAISEGYSKEVIADAMGDYDCIESMTWLTGEDGKKKKMQEYPAIVGGFRSLLTNESQDVLLAKIVGRENVNMVLERLKKCFSNQDELQYYVLPLVA